MVHQVCGGCGPSGAVCGQLSTGHCDVKSDPHPRSSERRHCVDALCPQKSDFPVSSLTDTQDRLAASLPREPYECPVARPCQAALPSGAWETPWEGCHQHRAQALPPPPCTASSRSGTDSGQPRALLSGGGDPGLALGVWAQDYKAVRTPHVSNRFQDTSGGAVVTDTLVSCATCPMCVL